MDEQTVRIAIFVIYGGLAFVAGYIVGAWKCRRDYAAILQTLIDMAHKEESKRGRQDEQR